MGFKNAKICPPKVLLEMPQKVIRGVAMTKICKMCILRCQKCQYLQTMFFVSNAPKCHLRAPMTKICKINIIGVKNADLGGQKCQYLQTMFFVSNFPTGHLRVSHDQNCNIYIIWGLKNTHLGVKNANICK